MAEEKKEKARRCFWCGKRSWYGCCKVCWIDFSRWMNGR